MKRTIFGMLCVFLGIFLIACSGGEPIDWHSLKLGEYAPVLENAAGLVRTNSQEELDVRIYDSTGNQFMEYVDRCVAMGYSIEAEEDDTSYEAYNEQGYKVSVKFSNNSEELRISLTAPREWKTIKWPFCVMAKLLPVPVSNQAEISWESGDGFYIYIGNTTKSEYDEYVQECQTAGFTVDYSKGEDYFYADNADGYSLSLNYTEFFTMSINLDAPDDMVVAVTTEPTEPTEEKQPEETTAPTEPEATEEKEELVDGLRPEFKKAMDEYEEFCEGYTAFMKKYNASGGTDLSMLTDYLDYVTQLTEMTDAFEKWNNEDMNAAELAYFLDVQNRVNKMLLDAAL